MAMAALEKELQDPNMKYQVLYNGHIVFLNSSGTVGYYVDKIPTSHKLSASDEVYLNQSLFELRDEDEELQPTGKEVKKIGGTVVQYKSDTGITVWIAKKLVTKFGKCSLWGYSGLKRVLIAKQGKIVGIVMPCRVQD